MTHNRGIKPTFSELLSNSDATIPLGKNYVHTTVTPTAEAEMKGQQILEGGSVSMGCISVFIGLLRTSPPNAVTELLRKTFRVSLARTGLNCTE